MYGNPPFSVCFVTSHRNNKGCMVYETSTTTLNPRTEIKAIDFNAGCSAKISTPIPTIAVKAEKKIAVLCAPNIFFPFLYSCNNPSIMKMLKSSQIPKMNVASIIFTILNLISNIAIIPSIITQLIAIGRKVKSVSSILPYEINNAKNTINDETNKI